MKINSLLSKFKFVYKLKSEVVGGCSTVVDLGCGKSSPLKFFSGELKHSLGIDGHWPSLDEAKRAGTHSEYLFSDILAACRKLADNSFDCALALDLIEHLDKPAGSVLINEMSRIAKKKIIIYTPNGFLKQGAIDGNEGQVHVSGWRAEEMKKLGFKVYGMSGFKWLRGEMGELKFKPRSLWRLISSLTQLPAYFFPRLAFQILCVKELNKI